jgi:hypothetical protein
MVNFKNLFVATSLLLGSVAAAPAPVGTLTTGVAIESRNINNALERRAYEMEETNDANNIGENEYATAMKIRTNGGRATVVNLTGCTALFFYMGGMNRRVAHILCGNEEEGAKQMAKDAGGATSVTIGASSNDYFLAAQRGVLASKPGLTINPQHIYGGWTATTAITLTGQDDSFTLTQGTSPR